MNAELLYKLSSEFLSDQSSDNDWSEHLHRLDDTLIATNRHVAIRVPNLPCDEFNTPYSSTMRAKTIDNLIKKTAEGDHLFSGVNEITLPKKTICEVCNGSGRNFAIGVCDACAGKKEIYCLSSSSHRVTFNGIHVFAGYIELISKLPNCVIDVVNKQSPHECTHPLYFKFDGGDGALAVMTTSQEKNT